MNHTEKLTRYVANFVDELHQSGVSDVVISPGSRSTPLALTFAEHPSINHWVNMDERSAAYFALGMAKQQNKAVALVCTSGTATANYYPAIVEAFYSRVPLVVLTADRPHELRDVGAPQAIEQINMFGEYVKWFHEMALPEATPTMLNYVRGKASRAVHTAKQGNSGPVQLNFPFREPLIPDFSLQDLWGSSKGKSYHQNVNGERQLSSYQLNELLSQIENYEKGLIVCGPQMEQELVDGLVALAEKWRLPILADPLSQLRAGKHDKGLIIESYDAILKSKKVRELLNPDFVIRFGAMPVSKPYSLFLKEKSDIKHFVVEAYEGHREPIGAAVQFIYANPSLLCDTLLNNNELSFDEKWLEQWKAMNEISKKILLEENSNFTSLTEGHAVTHLLEVSPEDSTLYVGNSMPIRDVDTFLLNTVKKLKILGNRGANGIDGLTSSALGVAAYGEKVTLLVGDLSFFHDFNGLLLAKQYQLNITVVLINNNGGGIFSFLPQANDDSEHFEVLFGTPLNIDFEHVITMYNGTYNQPSNWQEFNLALSKAYDHTGISVIEVKTNRMENVLWHREKWERIEGEILSSFEG